MDKRKSHWPSIRSRAFIDDKISKEIAKSKAAEEVLFAAEKVVVKVTKEAERADHLMGAIRAIIWSTKEAKQKAKQVAKKAAEAVAKQKARVEEVEMQLIDLLGSPIEKGD
jgi:hypothetical protein